MKIRLVTREQVKKAYGKNKRKNILDIKEELGLEIVEDLPKEALKILKGTLSFIEYINTKEDGSNEDK
ncbi:MAG: hypothetical protein GXZ06_07895 [Tissierellia bacterium]|nr:hypothetical protein [Tissierellia bacterium]